VHLQGASQQRPLPPINSSSSLLAAQPAIAPSSELATPDLSFDTFELQHALLRSRQQSGACGGLRRATSAPHSMDALGFDPASPQQGHPNDFGACPGYLPPSGGPMRRVQSSLGMRRSSSFFWTPSAHRHFEQAVNTLACRGVEITSQAIMSELSRYQLPDLKLADVDKHLRKKVLMQRRVLQQLGSDRPPLVPPSAADSQPPSSATIRGLAAPGLRQANASMAAVAEEPAAVSPAVDAVAAMSDGLAQQFAAQRMQHMQLAAAREALVAAAEGQMVPGQVGA
jgi:hypothetical protein